MIQCVCSKCKKEFKIVPAEKRRGGGKYCSRKCFLDVHQSLTRHLVCLNCGKDFTRNNANIKKGGPFCSKKCRGESQQKRIIKKCLTCGDDFSIPLSHENSSFYCSRKCMNKNIDYRDKLRLANSKTPKVKCICEYCGHIFFICPSEAKLGRGRFCSMICMNSCSSFTKMRTLKGPFSPLWKGGISPEKKRVRASADYEQWRKSVFERDNYICNSCHKRGDYLEAHHIKPFNKYPNLRFDINNGLTLCKICHAEIPRNYLPYVPEVKSNLEGINVEVL